MPWDLMLDYQWMKKATDCFMSLFRSLKPTIAVVHGAGAIAGGSDIALCCDFIVMSETARIGYPPARVWGCPTTAMWTFRIGAEKAKRMLLTGDLIDGRTARDYGLVIDCCPEEQLAERAMQLAERVASVPQNQLMMQKLVINQIVEHMGLHHAQVMATVFDGFARHSPEGVAFKRLCEQHGFKEAVRIRDQPPAIAAKL